MALPPPETSLNNCQNAVKTAGKKYVQNYVKAVGTCLQAVSTQIVKNNAANADAAAASCVSQFRRISDSRSLGLSLGEKLKAGIEAKCTPGGTNTHTLQDILGTGAGVSEPLNAENINGWCAKFGGDGSINTLDEWISCVTAAQACDARQAISVQYPRALEWLALVKTSMLPLSPPPTDLTKISDAIAGLTAVDGAIEGGNNDNKPNLQCGSSCGDGVKNGDEACDGSDLGGQTCAGLGYALAGTLSCTGNCGLDTSGCVGQAVPATGQTTCWNSSGTVISCSGTGHDGEIQAGATLAYVDNGDGTITDLNTKLMWEKKSDDGSIHDWDNLYTWSDAFSVFIAALNGGGGFAGHTDWRLPNAKELQSIVNYQNAFQSVSAAFSTGCAPTCTVTTCSCTQSFFYWSSTSTADTPSYAWIVFFADGGVYASSKAANYSVRAVRGGL